jgi:hypothetical protein
MRRAETALPQSSRGIGTTRHKSNEDIREEPGITDIDTTTVTTSGIAYVKND